MSSKPQVSLRSNGTKFFAIAILGFFLLRTLPVWADCSRDQYGYPQCGTGQCLQDRYGKVICSSKPGGGCAQNIYGKVECGPGQCVTNLYGQVVCSQTQGGGCATDAYGKVICN